MAKKYSKLGSMLKRLLFEKDIKAADLAREINIPPPTIHRLITGKSTRPYQSSLKPIADYFSITINQLTGEDPLQNYPLFGSDKHSSSLQKITSIPLIPWSELHSLEEINKINYTSIPFVGKSSESSYATIMEDSSMEPLFNRGCTLIIDPQKTAKDRSYILVQLHEVNLTVFRQLIIDLNYRYLKPLNSDLSTFQMRLLGEKDKIIGVLIEARQNYSET